MAPEVSLLHGFGGLTFVPGVTRRPFDYPVFGLFSPTALSPSLLTFSLYPLCFCLLLTDLAKIQQICRKRLFTSHPGAVASACFRAAIPWPWTTCQHPSLSSQSRCCPGCWVPCRASRPAPGMPSGYFGRRLKGN